MNTTAGARKCIYSIGQAVEVQVHDFAAAGQPLVWALATVTNVEPRDGGLFDVSIARIDGGFAHQIVGSRGGNKRVRAA